jgi:hypothetical protein
MDSTVISTTFASILCFILSAEDGGGPRRPLYAIFEIVDIDE